MDSLQAGPVKKKYGLILSASASLFFVRDKVIQLRFLKVKVGTWSVDAEKQARSQPHTDKQKFCYTRRRSNSIVEQTCLIGSHIGLFRNETKRDRTATQRNIQT
jgi:hypothetical protein